MKDKVPESEYCKTNSIYSTMRKGFFIMVRVATFFTLLTFGIFLSQFIIPNCKPIDITPLVTIDVALFGIAFGGKVGQAFSERGQDGNTPQDDKNNETQA